MLRDLNAKGSELYRLGPPEFESEARDLNANVWRHLVSLSRRSYTQIDVDTVKLFFPSWLHNWHKTNPGGNEKMAGKPQRAYTVVMTSSLHGRRDGHSPFIMALQQIFHYAVRLGCCYLSWREHCMAELYIFFSVRHRLSLLNRLRSERHCLNRN